MILEAIVLYRLAAKNISKAGERDLHSKEVKIVIAKSFSMEIIKTANWAFQLQANILTLDPVTYIYDAKAASILLHWIYSSLFTPTKIWPNFRSAELGESLI